MWGCCRNSGFCSCKRCCRREWSQRCRSNTFFSVGKSLVQSSPIVCHLVSISFIIHCSVSFIIIILMIHLSLGCKPLHAVTCCYFVQRFCKVRRNGGELSLCPGFVRYVQEAQECIEGPGFGVRFKFPKSPICVSKISNIFKSNESNVNAMSFPWAQVFGSVSGAQA